MGDHAMRMGARRSFAPRSHRRGHWKAAFAALVLIGIAPTAVGCGDGEGTRAPINAKARGELVTVQKGETTIGFARGTIRASERLAKFRISKHPITIKQYRACEAAKVCSAPKLAECSDPELARSSFRGVNDTAAVCVGRENAEAYCRWLGGRLPTLSEWLRAARGPEVQAYPWGDATATCAQHPRSVERAASAPRRVGCAENAQESLVTRKHAAGAANSGLEDVLITPAELVAGHERSPYSSCGSEQDCVVYGVNPGSIDSVRPYAVGGMYAPTASDEPRMHLTPEAYGFRCVIQE